MERILVGDEQRDLLLARTQRRRHLDAREPAAHERDVLDAVHARLEREVVLEVAEVTDIGGLGTLGAQATRATTGGEEQVAVLEHPAHLVIEAAMVGVEFDDLVAQADVDTTFLVPAVRMQWDALDGGLAVPQVLAQQRALIRPMVLAREQRDPTLRVMRADAIDGSRGGVATADDAITGFHGAPGKRCDRSPVARLLARQSARAHGPDGPCLGSR
jgi:hypothetical protein